MDALTQQLNSLTEQLDSMTRQMNATFSAEKMLPVIAGMSLLVSFFVCGYNVWSVNRQLYAATLNSCHERFLKIVDKIRKAQADESQASYSEACNRLFEHYNFEFMQWRLKLLPNNVYFSWFLFDIKLSEALRFTNAYGIKDAWDDYKKQYDFYYDSLFMEWMDILFKMDFKTFRVVKNAKKQWKIVEAHWKIAEEKAKNHKEGI